MSDSGWTKELVAERNAQLDRDIAQSRKHVLSEQERVRAAKGFVGALGEIAGLPVSPPADRATAGGASDPIKSRKPRAHPERDLEKACSDLLQLDSWRMLKTDPVSDTATVQRIRTGLMKLLATSNMLRPVLAVLANCQRGKGFGEVGMADCLYIRYGLYNARIPASEDIRHEPKIYEPVCEVLWIEYKSETGKLSQHQRLWHAAERACGAMTLIAGQDFPATVDGFLEYYRNSGLMRRPM